MSIYESTWNKELKKQTDIGAEIVSLRLGQKRPDMWTLLPYCERSQEDFEQRAGETDRHVSIVVSFELFETLIRGG